MRIRSIGVLLIAVVALGFAAPAFAASSVYYGSATAPIKAEDNSDDGNAWFYGAAAVIDHTWLRNRYWYRDSAPGGNKAYVTTDWYFWRPGCTTGNTCFDHDHQDRSTGITDGGWRLEEDYADLSWEADKGRAGTRVCEEQSWGPDDCSKYVYATLTY